MKANHPKVVFWKRVAMVLAILTVVSGVAGMASTIVGLVSAFETTGQSGEIGTATPEALAEEVAGAIGATAIGLGVSALAGLALILVAVRLIVLSKQEA